MSPARGPRAVAYLLFGTATVIAVAAHAVDLGRIPLVLGPAFLACAVACGPGDGPWGAGVLCLVAGLGALAADRAWLPVAVTPTTGAVAGALMGAAAVLLLHVGGLTIGLTATAATAVALAVVLVARTDLPAVGRPSTWGLWLILLGAVNLLLWVRDREADPPARPAAARR